MNWKSLLVLTVIVIGIWLNLRLQDSLADNYLGDPRLPAETAFPEQLTAAETPRIAGRN